MATTIKVPLPDPVETHGGMVSVVEFREPAGAGLRGPRPEQHGQWPAAAESFRRRLVECPRSRPACVERPALVSDIAAVVLAMHGQWQLIGAQIERARLTAKAAIEAAEDEGAARAVAPDWPAP